MGGTSIPLMETRNHGLAFAKNVLYPKKMLNVITLIYKQSFVKKSNDHNILIHKGNNFYIVCSLFNINCPMKFLNGFIIPM